MSNCFDYCHGVFRVCEGEVLGGFGISEAGIQQTKQDLGKSVHGTALEKQPPAVIKTISVMW